MTEDIPPRKIIPIEELFEPDFEAVEPTPPGLWDRVGDVHPGFTYALVLAILVGFAAQLVTASVGLDRALTGGSLTGPFVDAGAASRVPFLAGEWWRLLAPLFLHANLLHWAANCWSLYQLGTLYEVMFGSRRFLLTYFLTGACASIASS